MFRVKNGRVEFHLSDQCLVIEFVTIVVVQSHLKNCGLLRIDAITSSRLRWRVRRAVLFRHTDMATRTPRRTNGTAKTKIFRSTIQKEIKKNCLKRKSAAEAGRDTRKFEPDCFRSYIITGDAKRRQNFNPGLDWAGIGRELIRLNGLSKLLHLPFDLNAALWVVCLALYWLPYRTPL